ncbi:integrase, catalytic region, zinc finger, CCHC-type containing protein [Tanacetum coccineum]
MDSIIPLGQKNTLAEYMILSGADNRPPIEHDRMILESVEHGLLIWPNIEENGETKKKKYAELFVAEKNQVDCDMKATNIILQGLPSDVYALVNHHRVAKDIWERVQLLMQGTSLTKQERECKLYDAFDKFAYIKGESLHQYYLRFSQLINDMNIYNMILEQFQVNTKFLNSLPPEWSKFVTDVKLIKDLHTTNFDQLHAHLQQHELHANEVRLMRKRNQDPFALVANHQMTPPHNNTYQSSYNNPHLQQQVPSSQYGSIHPTPRYSSTYQSQSPYNHSSVPSSYPYQSHMNQQIASAPQVFFPSPQVSTQPMNESPPMDSDFDVPIFSPGDDPIACLNKAMAFLTAVASSRGDKDKVILVLVKRVLLLALRETMSIDKQGLLNAITVKVKDIWLGNALSQSDQGMMHDPGIPDGQTVLTIIPNNAAFQTEDLDTYDSDCDDISNAKAILMANISNFGSNVVTEVPNLETNLNDMGNQSVQAMQDFEQSPIEDFTDNEIYKKANKEKNNESITAELERYKERVKTFEQRLIIDLSSREKMINSQMDDMIKEKLALKEQVDLLEQNLSKQIKEKESLLQTFTVFKNDSKEKENKYMENEIDLEKKIKELDNIIFKVGQSAQTVHMLTKSQVFYDNTHKQALGYQNLFYLKKAQRIKPTLYDGIVISDKHVAMHVSDDEETLILEEVSRSKMSGKAKDPEAIKQNISNKPIDYEKLNRLSEDFEKYFFPQQELSAEQAFWFHMSNPTIESSNEPPVNVEVPSELPKVSLVNASLKKLKFHLTQFDFVVKKRTTPSALTEGEWGFEHTKAAFINEVIPFLKSLKDIFNVFDKDLLNEITEVQTVFDKMEAAVQQSSVDKQCLEIAKKELFLENDRHLQKIMSQDILLTVMNSMFLNDEYVNVEMERSGSCEMCLNLDAEFSQTKKAYNDLLKNYSQLEKHCMFELDLEHLAPKLLRNREAHIDYLRYTQEQADILREIVELAKAKHPLDSELNSARKHAQRIQELLVYVRDTCPNEIKLSAKKVAVTPKNNHKKVRFVEPLNSSSNIKQVESSKTSDSNTHVLSSTGVKCSTSNCGSKPTSNTKNDRISQSPSRNKKNKVEAQPRNVNKKNRVVEPIHDVDVKHSLINANSEPICATCKKSMFDGVHDMCVIDFVKNVTSRAKSAKKHTKQNIWKPTGHVFTDVGLKWKPTGRTFTIIGNSCPLTRITSVNIVPSKTTTCHSDEIQKSELKVYSRKPKNAKKVGSSKQAKIVESKNANHSEPNHTWGSNATDITSSSSLVITVRFGNDQIAKIMGYGDYQLGNVTISRVYYVEGLGHNLFSVGKFCDADLEVVFQKNTCFIRNLEGVDLLSGSRDTNLYTISLDDMLKTSPICLLSKALKTKSWLWHRRLSHLNFDEAPEAIIKCIKNIQVRLNSTVRNVRTDNGTEFVNQTLREFYENVGISHQTSVARTPQQNNVVERRNRTLVEASRTMLIFSKAPLFLWAEAINIACYTQNRSLIRHRYNKMPYELMQDKKLDLSFLYVFGSLCYPTNDNEDLGKFDAKADIGIFVGYASAKKAFRIYNKRTQKIIETIHVTFDELAAMASEQFSSGPGLHSMTPVTSSSGLVSNPVS